MDQKRDDETFLLSGQRVYKDDERLEACGTIDELSSMLGVVKAFLKKEDEVSEILTKIQEHLFVLGSQISGLGTDKPYPKIENDSLKYLEEIARRYGERLPRLSGFIYPGGVPAGALLHLARALCRRGERILVALSRRFELDPMTIAYINKLSGTLFVLARYVNLREGAEEKAWTRD